MKKIKLFTFLITTLFCLNIYSSYVFASITLNYDGKTVAYNEAPIVLIINEQILDQSTLPMQPIIINGSTLVPVREIFEKLGAVVDYKAETQEVFIAYKDNLILLGINSPTYYVNGQSYTFKTPPKIINGKTMIPLRAVSEGMGLLVNWDGATRTINISEKKAIIDEPIIPVEPIIPTEPVKPVIPIIPAVDLSGSFTRIDNDTSFLNKINTLPNTVEIEFNMPITDIKKQLLDDNRLVLDIENSVNTIKSSITVPENLYYKEVRTSQFSTDPTLLSRVVIKLNEGVNFKVLLSQDRKSIVVYLGDGNSVFPNQIENEVPAYTQDNDVTGNILYDTFNHSLLISKSTGIKSESVLVDDYDAFRKKIVVTLNGNYSNIFSSGVKYIYDDKINSYYHSLNSDNLSTLTITLNQWGTLNVTEDEYFLRISFINPKKLYDKILVIDAGHGATDPGSMGNGLVEKELNFIVAQRLGEYMKSEPNIKVYYTRIDDTLLELAEIGKFATAMGDFLFSVHTNSYETESPNGVEILYLEHDNDSTIGISSEASAKIILKNFLNDLGLTNRGVKRFRAVIFKNSEIPSIIGEMAFLSNTSDAAKLADINFLDSVAKSYKTSVVEIFSVYTPKR